MPRSRWNTMTDIDSAHTTSSGPRSRARGNFMPRNFVPTIDSESRLRTRYPAKNTASAIFAISPGWNVAMSPKPIHTRAPPRACPSPGTSGRMSRMIATSPARYV